MRYDRSNLGEMESRLADLDANFAAAVSGNGKFVYVGPKVEDARSIRQQDFVPLDQVAVLREKLVVDIHACSPQVQ